MPDIDSWSPSPLLRRADALADGVSDRELARLVRRGELSRLRRGAYIQEPAEFDRVQRYLATVLATVAGLRLPAVVSHVSAAILHGLPVWNVPLGRVHVLRRPPAAGSGTRRLHQHVARIPDDEVCMVSGLIATDVSRTSSTSPGPCPSSQRWLRRTLH